MSKREVKVVVTGYTGSGKSTIQAVIVEALRQKGFETELVSLDFVNEAQVLSNSQMLLDHLPELVDKIKVTVEERQLMRSSMQ